MAFPSTAAAPTATAFATSVTSMPVNMPSSIASGDLLIAFVHVRNAGTWTLPSGWTDISTLSQGGGGTVGKLNGFYKIAAGTESGTTPTWTSSIGTTGEWQTYRVTGWHGTTPPEATTTNGDASAANPPSLTPSWGADDTLWIALAGHSAGSTAAWSAGPSSYSGFQINGASSGGSAVSIASAYRQLNASSEDPGAYTVSGSNRFWSSGTIAIRPATGGGGVTVTPDVASLTTTTYAPTVTITENKAVTPGVASLTLTLYAPTVTATSNQTVTPNTASLTITTYQPSVVATANVSITPANTSLSITTYAPTISVGGNVSVTPDTASVSFISYAPVIVISNNKVVTPDIASLVTSTFAPVVAVTDNTFASPDIVSLSLTTYAPTVSVTSGIVVTPGTPSLTLTPYLPTVTATNNIIVTPSAVSLILTAYAPIVTILAPSTDSPIIVQIGIQQEPPIRLSISKEPITEIRMGQEQSEILVSKTDTVVAVTKGATISI